MATGTILFCGSQDGVPGLGAGGKRVEHSETKDAHDMCAEFGVAVRK